MAKLYTQLTLRVTITVEYDPGRCSEEQAKEEAAEIVSHSISAHSHTIENGVRIVSQTIND